MNTDYSKQGLKQTEARSAVVMILGNSNGPLDVAGIKEELEKLDLKVDQATVYRILNTFHEKGIVKRIEIGEGKYRYEIEKEHHHHLVCTNCGKIEDIEIDLSDDFDREVFKKKGFRVESHSLEFFGVCELCQK